MTWYSDGYLVEDTDNDPETGVSQDEGDYTWEDYDAETGEPV